MGISYTKFVNPWLGPRPIVQASQQRRIQRFLDRGVGHKLLGANSPRGDR